MVKWYGDQIKSKTDRVIQWALNKVASECVRDGKNDAPRLTTALQGSVQMRPAQKDVRGWFVIWGSFNNAYAVYIVKGTKPHVIYPRVKKALFWDGAPHPVRFVNHPGTKANPFLQKAAAKNYPHLSEYIKREMSR